VFLDDAMEPPPRITGDRTASPIAAQGDDGTAWRAYPSTIRIRSPMSGTPSARRAAATDGSKFGIAEWLVPLTLDQASTSAEAMSGAPLRSST